MNVKGYAVHSSTTPLAPFSFERRIVGPQDVLIKILYSGICHSDIHQARNEWGNAVYPMVPGHEIVGLVEDVGSAVNKFKVGDKVGVGCMVNSCRKCSSCTHGDEQFCEVHTAFTYNSTENDLTTPTQGGYSSHIVVDDAFVLRIPDALDLKRVAPLLCAGITTYSPLRHWKIGEGTRLGVIGLGGLGHMAVKLGSAMGAHVSVLSTSISKEADARSFGANEFIVSSKKTLAEHAKKFDLILNTSSAISCLDPYLSLLDIDGVMVLIGVPNQPSSLHAFSLISGRRTVTGSLIGGIVETQEMLDFCSKHSILPEIEMIPISEVNNAFDRTVKADVRYRFVIDMATL
ncbi:MAG: NAD(P)-dependent alcohol dehydrogenase [Alphaproteobacteria bacterium]|nr:NAD(P)-dependent alcohol dehydrogenase [Alphaproteobacteria bacterium]